jgi:molybdenum cofactor synthesis domain-containing protein
MTPRPLRFAVLTVSDRCSVGHAEDRSGPALVEAVTSRLGGVLVERGLVPDEIAAIRAAVARWSSPSAGIDLVLTTGGTGLAPRDLTPEALTPMLERLVPGLHELARQRLLPTVPRAALSRGIAGTIGRTLVIALPGSPGGAVETFAAMAEVLPHALAVLGGTTLDHARH